ncbi:transcriptional regulator CtsR [Keratinibaculum paraultunense]|uniref:Transcriptional regulator CtsR n=1 Tax=Keratinibaculum paraultunense TaxID=1278232 RepID=A0A4R3KT66_9FIRM|nr:CtsR family transcriptional regulator [Keratinibaculum paraultunense]QQY79449.1 CtsR family transcriptional regulator [Keratinibaculum paraultunense]TCS88058.1 transcriptional regulator CtsR [Keratinibaculum paraultunense]
MTGMSNLIERFIKEMLEEAEDGIIEIGRNELAEQFGCAPSQINYVLTTRFTPYKGYYIESRRGGGGYIKIVKVGIEEDEDMEDLIVNTIGKSVTKNKAYHIIEGLVEEGVITEREGYMMKAAIEDNALRNAKIDKNHLRADILKNMLLIIMRQ